MATVLNDVVTAPAQPSAVLGTYRPAPPLFTSARGCHLFDDTGKAYLDFAAGIGVNALGYGDHGVFETVQASLESGLIHTSNLFRTQPQETLAAELVARSFADSVFFCNSGAESNEAAFKFARRYAREIGGATKHEIVSMRNAFHGRLFGALAATDRRAMREPFEPLMPGVRFIDIGDIDAAQQAITRERTAAVIIEPVQGEGGVQPVAPQFLAALRALCDAADALLIFDEVQCGLGRTGTLFAYEHSGVVPDLLTLAKPLAGGLPMGVTLLAAHVAAAIRPGDHATTFGGGPLVASVANYVVKTIGDAQFLSVVRQRGAQLQARLEDLRELPAVHDVRGIGLMWGIELNIAAAPVVAAALDSGLLVTAAGEKVVRLLPPLVISEADVDCAVDILREVLS
ncbi:MAG TPA: acetylornithine/succinylornithine family transaminase [Longimicrobiales bacterium]|nr:acetylornithine/succinylornithine family transaminase [Longimicrobiales bacterium]